ncbi:hypothetical protein G6011_05210 [Alternaria panax]|uniref:Beta-lactamase-related domain-containing protein n=1 Tax=Alternaria panax TaxID=48097 RepID=A0AAD4FGV1_9PLEO|nr:hypothetical protein G6011_05210 [Alternaria panax]
MAYKTPDLEKIKEFYVLGLSLAVVQGDVIYSNEYAYSQLPDTEISTETLFNLASTSKSTTAGAVVLLVDDEKCPDVQ